MRFKLLAALAAFTVALPLLAEPFWGAKTSRPAETDPANLKRGEFIWAGEESPSGPIVVVVSLPEQRAYVYRNGVRIGVTTVSTGKKGHQTPTGIFTVLQKDRHHHSNKYNNAAMPDTQRLTWDGVALHAGGLPGYPSSHGCVHLPSVFAERLFDASQLGMTVVIADENKAPEKVAHPGAIAPVDAATGAPLETAFLGAAEEFRWQPEKAPAGPLSVVVSGADQRMLVYRNGVEIGRARVAVQEPEIPLGTHAFVMLDDQAPGAEPHYRWVAVGIPGHAGEDKQPLDPAHAGRVQVPVPFRAKLHDALHPGATLVVTDAPVLEHTTAVDLRILNSGLPVVD